jgi:hypothetical protein
MIYMKDKTTMSVDKTTTELVKRVKRKMSFDFDQDFTTDEAITKLCIAYLGNEADEVTEPIPAEGAEGTETVEAKGDE